MFTFCDLFDQFHRHARNHHVDDDDGDVDHDDHDNDDYDREGLDPVSGGAAHGFKLSRAEIVCA